MMQNTLQFFSVVNKRYKAENTSNYTVLQQAANFYGNLGVFGAQA